MAIPCTGYVTPRSSLRTVQLRQLQEAVSQLAAEV